MARASDRINQWIRASSSCRFSSDDLSNRDNFTSPGLVAEFFPQIVAIQRAGSIQSSFAVIRDDTGGRWYALRPSGVQFLSRLI
jgi:hypothetical protein